MTNKISDKDRKDWQKFLDSSEKLQSKDSYQLNDKIISERSIDLHGYTLEEANKQISEFIDSCYINKVKKVNIITGKGMRSKSAEDPYKSSELSILKHSIPEFINSNVELMRKIKNIDDTNEKNLGSFNVYLKSKNKFR